MLLFTRFQTVQEYRSSAATIPNLQHLAQCTTERLFHQLQFVYPAARTYLSSLSIHKTLAASPLSPLCQGPQIQGLFGSLMNNSERHYPSGFGIFMTIFGQRVDPNRPEVVVTSHQQTSETSGRKWRSLFWVLRSWSFFLCVLFFLLTSSHRGRRFLSV